MTADSDRIPPHALEAEAAVIATAAESPDHRALVLDTLRREHFYSGPNGLIWEAIASISADSDLVDQITITTWLRDHGKLASVDADYLERLLIETPFYSNIEEHAAIITAKWRQRQTVSTCQRIAAEGYGEIEDVQAWIDRSEQDIFAIAAERPNKKPERVKAILTDRFGNLEDRLKNERATRVKTGIGSLDSQIVGLSAPNLIILAARPGMGKSSLASAIARNVARTQGGVAVFSLEMSREELVDQMLCSDARVDSRLMAEPEKIEPGQWSRITAASGELCKLPLWIDDDGGLGLTALRAKCRRIAAQCKAAGTELRLVIIDYLQLMGVNAKASSREQQVAENSRGLKLLAKNLNVPVIALSQLNRSLETQGKKNRRPMLSDLRESGAIEQDADQVWFIWHDDNDAEDVATVIVAKGRRFGCGDVKVKWTAQFTRFDNIEQDEYREYANRREETF